MVAVRGPRFFVVGEYNLIEWSVDHLGSQRIQDRALIVGQEARRLGQLQPLLAIILINKMTCNICYYFLWGWGEDTQRLSRLQISNICVNINFKRFKMDTNNNNTVIFTYYTNV